MGRNREKRKADLKRRRTLIEIEVAQDYLNKGLTLADKYYKLF